MGAEIFAYANDDGNDVIHAYDTNDTIVLISGSYNGSTKSDDIVLNVGHGTITLKDAV